MPNGPMYQGRTHNHLSWVMVDATDFATPESALSGAKIMVNGKLQSTSLLYFVSSGTGSMAGGDIKHVGLSATGVYTVNLVKADLSDASAAWYDQYIFTITGTGAAQQVIVCEGVLSKNIVSNISDYLSKMSDVVSNAYSAAAQGTSKAVKIYSMLSDTLSTMNSQFAVTSNYLSNASNYLSNISAFASDIDSAMTSQFTIVASRVKGNSDYLSKLSDTISNAYSAAAQGTSQILLTKVQATAAASRASDIRSRMDSASYLSDIASHVWTAKYTGLSAASSFGSLFSDVYSRLVKTQSNALAGASRAVLLQSSVSSVSNLLSDVDSALTSHLTIINSINSRVSDMRSRMDSASFMSDIASHVWTAKYTGLSAASSFGSLLSDIGSRVKGNSDYLSKMSDVLSNAYSAAAQGTSQTLLTKTQATAAASRATKIYSMVSDTLSTMNSQFVWSSDALSDIRSAVGAAAAPTTSAIAAKVWSDFGSLVGRTPSDVFSDLLNAASNTYSAVTTIGSDVLSQLSDIRSAVGNITVALTASDISDIASAVAAAATGVTASDIKNIAVKVWSDFQSKVGRSVSDVMSDLLNTASDMQSAVALIPKSDGALTFNVTAVGNIKAGLATQSNLDSGVLNILSALSDTDSALNSQYTKVYSAVNKGGSQLLVNQSTASNIYELLSDVDSALTSQLAKQTSQFTKVYSGISDIQVAETSHFAKTNSQLNVNVITVNDTYSLLSSLNSDFQVGVPVSLPAAIGTGISDIYSLLSDFNSDFQSRVPKLVATASQVSDLSSDVKSAVTTIGSDVISRLSDVRSAIGNINVDGDAIADALLDRDLGAGVDTGTATKRTPRQALRFLRNRWQVGGNSLVIRREDDVTQDWKASVVGTPGADPITKVEPEGP